MASPTPLNKGLALVLMVSLGLLATGCSLGKKSVATEASPPKVRVWRYNQDVDPLRDSIVDYEKKYAETNVKVLYERHTLDTYEYDALKSAASLNGPDIWNIPSDWIADYQGMYIPLESSFFADPKKKDEAPAPTAAVKSLFPEGIARTIVADNKVIGMPGGVDVLRIYYNPDLLSDASREYRQKAGSDNDSSTQAVSQLLKQAPKTWNELIEQTTYITVRNGNEISRSAIALGTSGNTPNAVDILHTLMLQNGVGIVSDDHKTAAFHLFSSTPSGTSVRPGDLALDFFTSFSNPTKKNYTWNESMGSALDAFGQGKVAMVIGFKGFADELKSKYPKLDYDTAPIPQISTTAKGVNLVKFSLEGVLKTTRADSNADTASANIAFLKEYTSRSVIKSVAKEQKLFSPYLADISEKDKIASQILTGTTVYKKNHREFDQAFLDMISNVSLKGTPVGEAIDNGAQRITQLLNK